MLPSSTSEDIADGSPGNSKLSSDVFIYNSLSNQDPDLPDRVLIDLGVSNIAANQNGAVKNLEAVADILAACVPFEIDESVVATNSVLVIALRLLRIDSKKCFENQSVNPYLRHLPILAKADVEISSSHPSRFDNANLATIIGAITSYATKIGHTIKSFITGDCFPNFGGGNFVRHISLSIQGWFRLGVRSGINRSDAAFF